MTRARRRIAANVEGQRHRDALAAVKADYERRCEAVMRFLAAGDLKVSEAADILGMSPQTIRRWCKAAGIDPRAARAGLLVRLSKVAHLFAPAFDQMMRARNPNYNH